MIRIVVTAIRVFLSGFSTGPALLGDADFLPLVLRIVVSSDHEILARLDDSALSVHLPGLLFLRPSELSALSFWGQVRRSWTSRTPEKRDMDV